MLEKFLKRTATPQELKEFASNLGFNSIDELNSEYLKFAVSFQSIKNKYPEYFDKNVGKEKVAVIA